MAAIPNFSNFFASLHTPMSQEAVANLFGEIGWKVRKCSWTDYEVICDWAELIIEGDAPILLHGPVADVLEHAEELVAPLRNASIDFTAECYGPEPEHALLLELR